VCILNSESAHDWDIFRLILVCAQEGGKEVTASCLVLLFQKLFRTAARLIGFIWPPHPRREECIHCTQLGFPATVEERRVDRFISTSLLPLLVSATLFFSCEFRRPWELNVLGSNACASKIETRRHKNVTKMLPSFIKRPYLRQIIKLAAGEILRRPLKFHV
jgi:hypothetical protein